MWSFNTTLLAFICFHFMNSGACVHGIKLVFFFVFLMMCISGQMTAELRNFLELTLPKVKEGKKPKFSLGVAEPKLGSHIYEVTKIPCQSNEFVLELLRGVRMHFDKFIENLKVGFLNNLFSKFNALQNFLTELVPMTFFLIISSIYQ